MLGEEVGIVGRGVRWLGYKVLDLDNGVRVLNGQVMHTLRG